MLEGSVLGKLSLRALVLAHCPELTSFCFEVCGVAMMSLALFCSCCEAFLLAFSLGLLWGFGLGPMVGCPTLESVGFSFTEKPLAWGWSSGLLGFLSGLMTGLQCGTGGGFSAGLGGAGPYVLWPSYIVLVGIWSWAISGLCVDFVFHHSPLIQIVMLRIMTRTAKYCCDLVYSEFIMLYIFL